MWGWDLPVGRKMEVIGLAGIVAALITAVLWGAWSIFAPVPEMHASVPFIYDAGDPRHFYWELPFAVSRWWDIVGALFTAALLAVIWLILLPFLYDHGTPIDDLVVYGLGVVIVYGMGIGLVYGLGVGAGIGLVAGLVVAMVYGLGYGLGAGLVYGMVYAMVAGLVVGVGIALYAVIKVVARGLKVV